LNSGAAEDEMIDEMLKTGVIQPLDSAWASPVCLVKQKDGTYCFCVDYRKLNLVSRKDTFPLPDIREALDNLKGAKFFVSLDMLLGYWQILTRNELKRDLHSVAEGGYLSSHE